MSFSKSPSNDAILRDLNREKPCKRITDILCYLSNYISLVPTLIYNVIWFFTFRDVILSVGGEILFSEIETNIKGCADLYNWANYSMTWTTISFYKALFLLAIVKICCGSENDCNIFCLLIKSITSLIPTIIFVLNVPDIVKLYRSYNMNNISELKDKCDILADTIQRYYRYEYLYMLSILLAFSLIPIGAMLMCLKEVWKTRGYKYD